MRVRRGLGVGAEVVDIRESRIATEWQVMQFLPVAVADAINSSSKIRTLSTPSMGTQTRGRFKRGLREKVGSDHETV